MAAVVNCESDRIIIHRTNRLLLAVLESRMVQRILPGGDWSAAYACLFRR